MHCPSLLVRRGRFDSAGAVGTVLVIAFHVKAVQLGERNDVQLHGAVDRRAIPAPPSPTG